MRRLGRGVVVVRSTLTMCGCVRRVGHPTDLRAVGMVVLMRGEMDDGRELDRQQEHDEQPRRGLPPHRAELDHPVTHMSSRQHH